MKCIPRTYNSEPSKGFQRQTNTMIELVCLTSSQSGLIFGGTLLTNIIAIALLWAGRIDHGALTAKEPRHQHGARNGCSDHHVKTFRKLDLIAMVSDLQKPKEQKHK